MEQTCEVLKISQLTLRNGTTETQFLKDTEFLYSTADLGDTRINPQVRLIRVSPKSAVLDYIQH
jgi:hypothetical protein